MSFLGNQAKGIAASAIVAASLPDEVNQAKEMVSDMLPENMKAALGVTAVVGSFVYNTIREGGSE